MKFLGKWKFRVATLFKRSLSTDKFFLMAKEIRIISVITGTQSSHGYTYIKLSFVAV